MTMRIRVLVIALSVILRALTVEASLERDNRHGEVHLTVWYLPRPEDTTINARCFRAIIRAFREKYPHIKLSSPAGIVIPEMSAMDTEPLMAIAGGVSPDVIYVNFRQSDTYIQEGFLYPLDEWFEKLPEDEREERLLPQVEKVVRRLGPGRRTGEDTKKHYWALPYSTCVKGLCWRKDLFQAVGLDPERPPRNWEELHEFAMRCTDPEKGTYGIRWSKGPDWSAHFYSILCSAGAKAIEERGEDEWHAVFNSTEAVDAYEFVLKLVQGKWTHPSGKTVEGVVCREQGGLLLWAQGRIGMIETYFSDDLLADINPELVGLAPVPAGPSGKRVSELNCAMCGIFSGTAAKGKDVLDAAWKYVHFIGSPEARAIRTRVLVENGYGMFANHVYLERLGYTDYLRRIPESWRKAFDEAMANGEPEPYGRNCQMIYKYMSDPANEMILEKLGQAPVDQARKRIKEILDDYAMRANEKMIGHVPEDELRKRRTVALIAGMAMLVLFAGLLRHVAKAFASPDAAGGWQFHRYWPAYLLLIPALAGIALWQYVPMLWGAVLAFQDYHIVLPGKWAGLDNFAAVLWDPEFWQSLRASLWYAFLSIIMGFFAPICLAILLHEIPKGKIFYRTLYYLPAVISGLVVMLMWKNFFEPTEHGLLNRIITGIPAWGYYLGGGVTAAGCAFASRTNSRNGHSTAAFTLGILAILTALGTFALWRWGDLPLECRRWLDDPHWAMPCVVLPTVWAGIGPGCLIYLAALKTIPEELYEAADLDGAGFLGKIRHVTIPTIKVLIVINFIGAVVNAFQVAEYILAMTGGEPAGATRVLALKIFFDAFVYLRFGFATATAWILGAMLIGFTVFQLRRLSMVEYRRAQ